MSNKNREPVEIIGTELENDEKGSKVFASDLHQNGLAVASSERVSGASGEGGIPKRIGTINEELSKEDNSYSSNQRPRPGGGVRSCESSNFSQPLNAPGRMDMEPPMPLPASSPNQLMRSNNE